MATTVTSSRHVYCDEYIAELKKWIECLVATNAELNRLLDEYKAVAGAKQRVIDEQEAYAEKLLQKVMQLSTRLEESAGSDASSDASSTCADEPNGFSPSDDYCA